MARAVSPRNFDSILGHLHQAAVKRWLKKEGLAHTASNRDTFNSRLAGLIQQGVLSRDDLRSAALEIEESAGKQIYLRTYENLDRIRSKAGFQEVLLRGGVRNLADSPTRSVKLPAHPTLNYVFWSPNEIRIKYSETHIDPKPDAQYQAITQIEETKFAVIIVTLGSGLVQIRLDPAGRIHAHRDSLTNRSMKNLYRDFYLSKAADLLGVTDLPLYDLHGVASEFATSDFVEIPIAGVLTSNNSYCKMSKVDDVRNDPKYSLLMGSGQERSALEDLACYFLPERSEDAIDRRLFMTLTAIEGKISFRSDCLSHEVDYALSRIKEIRDRISSANGESAIT